MESKINKTPKTEYGCKRHASLIEKNKSNIRLPYYAQSEHDQISQQKEKYTVYKTKNSDRQQLRRNFKLKNPKFNNKITVEM